MTAGMGWETGGREERVQWFEGSVLQRVKVWGGVVRKVHVEV